MKRVLGVPCAVLAAAALLMTSCARGRSLKGVRLPALAGGKTLDLAFCPAPKCLTVVVAPWCGYCRGSTGMINALKGYLGARGVATRIVVGQDREAAVRDYAREFGPDTLLDPSGRIDVSGVPNFIVSDPSGRILQSRGGVPAGIEPPYSDEILREIAEAYGVL